MQDLVQDLIQDPALELTATAANQEKLADPTTRRESPVVVDNNSPLMIFIQSSRKVVRACKTVFFGLSILFFQDTEAVLFCHCIRA